MRFSLPALARAVKAPKGPRSREVLRLAEAARNDADRSWSRKTAAVLAVCVRNEPAGAATWDAVRLFAQLPPRLDDVRALLPLLQRRAAGAAAVRVVGDLAAAHALLATLAPPFLSRYMLDVSGENPFRAVQLWKSLPAPLRDGHTGALLYIAAGQPLRAEQLAAEAITASPTLIRRFIEHYAAAADAGGVQHWVDRWQAPEPSDVNWLHHLVGATPELRTVLLPQPLDAATQFPVRRAIGKRMQHLVSAVNGIIAANPVLAKNSGVRERWMRSVNDPRRATLEALALAIAEQRIASDWTPVLKLVSFDTGRRICELVPPLPPAAYAAVLSRAQSPTDVAHVLELLAATPETLYTRECLSALAQRSPALFLELALPPETLDLTLTPHHLAALWRAGPSDTVTQWLLPLTMKSVGSVGVVRSACIWLLQQQRLGDAARLIYEVVVSRRLHLDARVIDSLVRARRGEPLKLQKLPRPHKSGHTQEAAVAEYEAIMSTLGLSEQSKLDQPADYDRL